MRGGPRLPVIVVLAALGWVLSVVHAQPLDLLDRNHQAINYAQPSNDPVATLQRRADVLRALTPDGRSGYLKAILQALDVPVSSQILVFSQGSVQSPLIN